MHVKQEVDELQVAQVEAHAVQVLVAVLPNVFAGQVVTHDPVEESAKLGAAHWRVQVGGIPTVRK